MHTHTKQVDDIQKDKEAIKALAGCYEVQFQYAEVASPHPDYKFSDRYTSKATEWVTIVEETDTKISLQHLLIVGPGKIIKHWRQDWVYENTDFYTYHLANKWKYHTLPVEAVKGQWTQKVYQVDDSPRYEASGSWIHQNGKHYWESETDAPLPRREHTSRSDYNVMARRNRHELTPYGHVHEQDNKKIIRNKNKDELLVIEKGLNIYTRVDDCLCEPAKEWWEKNKHFWADVRTVWNHIYTRKEELEFSLLPDTPKLYEKLFALGDETVQKTSYHQEKTQQQILAIICQYMKTAEEIKVEMTSL